MDDKILNFTIFCVGSVADKLKMNARDVYHKLQEADIIKGYIIPCYDVLHTLGKGYLVDDITEFVCEKLCLEKINEFSKY